MKAIYVQNSILYLYDSEKASTKALISQQFEFAHTGSGATAKIFVRKETDLIYDELVTDIYSDVALTTKYADLAALEAIVAPFVKSAGGTDTDAIHKSTSAEISTITEKVAVVTNDLVLIEDSEDTNSKKSVKLGNLTASLPYASSTDPAIDAAVTTAIIDANQGVIITLTGAGNSQTLQSPTLPTNREFIVSNNDTSTDDITVNTITLSPGEAQKFFYDGTAWEVLSGVDAKDISLIPADNITATNVQSAIYQLDAIKETKISPVLVDATTGSASITDFTKAHYIQAAATDTTITVPNAATNTDKKLYLFKFSGTGELIFRTVNGTDLLGGYDRQYVHDLYQGYVFVSDGTEWKLLFDTTKVHTEIITSDYLDTEDWHLDHLVVDTSAGDVNVKMPTLVNLTAKWREKKTFILINKGINNIYFDFNGTQITGHPAKWVLWRHGGRLECFWDGSILIPNEATGASPDIKPDDIANLELWLEPFDSATISTTGSLIDSITDKSTKGNDFSGAGATRPDILADGISSGNNSIQFTASELLTAGDVELHDNTRGFTAIVLIKPSNTGDYFFSKYASNQYEWYMGTSRSCVYETLTGTRSSVNTGLDYGNWQFLTIAWTPTEGHKVYINNVFQGSGSTSVATIENGTAELRLGDAANLAGYLGEIGFVAAYSRGLSYTEIQEVIDYASGILGLGNIIPTSTQSDIFERDDTTNTINPVIPNDNFNIGTGDIKAGAINLSRNITFEGQSNTPVFTLADAATITPNFDNGSIQTVTLTGNRTIANPTNLKNGATYILIIKQDATGSRTVAWGTNYKFSDGIAPTLTTTANAVDIVTFISDGTNLYGVLNTNFS